MNTLLYVAEALVIAYLMKHVAFRLKLPSVTGYVVGGVLIGGSLLYQLPGGQVFAERYLFYGEVLEQFGIVTQIALAIIALYIGIELEWRRLKDLGISIVCIAFAEAFTAFAVVATGTWLLGASMPFALMLGAIASATAPPATVAVIQQYRSKGPLTSTILAVVGIDDAFSLIIFAFILSLTKGSLSGQEFSLATGVVEPVEEILFSILLGGGLGLLATYFVTDYSDQEDILFLMGAEILFISGLASMNHLSPLLANMAFGAALVNLKPMVKHKIESCFFSLTPVFYALFFIVGGAYFDFSIFGSIWLISLVYFICRSAGKTAGAYAGAIAGRALPKVRNAIGFSLWPQVGVGVALALLIQDEFGAGQFGPEGVQIAQDTMNILLVTTLLTESIGPFLTKMSLIKAGEAAESHVLMGGHKYSE